MHVLIPAVSRFTQLTGICRHAINHAKAVAGIDEVSRVTLVTGEWQAKYFQEFLDGSDRKIGLEAASCRNRSVSRNLWYAHELPRVARRLGAERVHLSYPVPVRRSCFSVPLLATIHDLYPFDHPENFGFPAVLFNRMFLKRCIKAVDAVVCVSEETRARLLHHCAAGAEQKVIATIYSYSELELADPTRPANFSITRFILAVGQHRKNKNHDLLIRAYQQLASSGAIDPEVGLVIAGAEGPETSSLQSLVKTLGIENRVQFLYAVSDDALAWLYRNCAVFVAASSIEGFCLPLLEAMQLARRVVCSDINIFKEVTNGGCELFSLQPGSPRQIAEAIQQALSSVARARKIGDARFTRQGASRAYRELYLELLNTHRDPVTVIESVNR
jgi:glycosyltransferase involved in cell wall biosynthesis